ncbi:hypothetical protein [Bacillus sp. Marseille-P3800]|uniref:hypothetical protein n=1 Tax=Bacillus sp. Marseille-P3800 TaxID=2014782 RepID=UPI000C08500B|nr:hypothetical protein [Bacillus sp. Marseille-P3800]
MEKTFEINYEDHHILVINTWVSGEKLFIDGELQDENVGLALRGTLNGSFVNNHNQVKNVKVSIGGTLSIKCIIFVDNVQVYPNQK